MSEILNEIVDLYKEHSQHTSPYWKMMRKCSECYKKHNEIIGRNTSYARNSGDWRDQQGMENHALQSLYNRDNE